jgi:hypothetical protein
MRPLTADALPYRNAARLITSLFERPLMALLGSGTRRVWWPLTVPKRTLTNRLSACL